MRNIIPLACLLIAWSSPALAAPRTFTTKNYAEKFSTGLRNTPQSSLFSLHSPRRSTNSTHVVPARFSMRGRAGPVEDQGGCGSCWDFSLTTVLRGTWMMIGRDPGRLSFNYLLNCDREVNGCDGGNFTAAAYLVSPRGAPPYGSDGPYTARQGPCDLKPPVSSAVRYFMLGPAGGSPSFRDIAYVLGVLRRPVSVDVAMDSTWNSYRSGVYNACTMQNPALVNHMVSIEGYDCETSVDKAGNCVFDKEGNLPRGVGTWILRNSWGTRWGDRGYMTTKATDKKGVRCNSIGNEALYFEISGSPR